LFTAFTGTANSILAVATATLESIGAILTRLKPHLANQFGGMAIEAWFSAGLVSAACRVNGHHHADLCSAIV
jgi:hypothetical protein